MVGLDSDISMSCVPANRQATSRGEGFSTDTDTPRKNIKEFSDSDEADDPKHRIDVRHHYRSVHLPLVSPEKP